MLVVIVGSGQMGVQVANQLSREGKSLILVDKEENAFANLSTDFSGFRIVGDATQIEVLRQAKVDQADLLLVLTGDDNINLTVGQIGKKFLKAKHTVARVFAPDKEKIFHKLGLDTICPTRQAVEVLMQNFDQYTDSGPQ
ncbi:MAG: potassium channel family protein [Vulcanimicrobiota bacterium]